MSEARNCQGNRRSPRMSHVALRAPRRDIRILNKVISDRGFCNSPMAIRIDAWHPRRTCVSTSALSWILLTTYRVSPIIHGRAWVPDLQTELTIHQSNQRMLTN
jgi:hypothetical protein